MEKQALMAPDFPQSFKDILEAPVIETTVLMNKGQPKAVLMSAEEFRRLKTAAGELIPASALPVNPLVLRGPIDDPLGYDTSDIMATARLMVADARSGKTGPAIAAERARVLARLGLPLDRDDIDLAAPVEPRRGL